MARLARGSMWWALVVVCGAGAASTLQAASCPSQPAPPYQEHSFLGFACRDAQCSAHKAGFEWADRQGLSDGAACVDAEDAAFVEGCRAFAELAVTAEQSGFEWARENEVSHDCFCDGAGPRFAAGCEAYVGGFAR